jgi:hypothetical protein
MITLEFNYPPNIKEMMKLEIEEKLNLDSIAFESVFPAGESVVAITDIREKQQKNGSGWYLEVEMINDDGQKIFDRILLGNKDSAYREKALVRWGLLQKACGKEKAVEDTDDLLNLACVVVVVHKQDITYGTQAKILKYLPELTNSKKQQDDKPY